MTMTIEDYALNLRLVAALAEKTAGQVMKGQLWQGDLDQAVSQMQKWLSEIPKERR